MKFKSWSNLLLLKLRTEDGEQASVRLIRSDGEKGGATKWVSGPGAPTISIVQSADGQMEVSTSDSITTSKEEVAEQFLELLKDAALQEAGGMEFSEEAPESQFGAEFPYDPETIRVDTKPFNISLVYEMIKDGDINLSPDFQRQFVWTDVGARSRLIESIMLRIPLPVFYMAQDRAGRLHVVDGLQRLTVIRQFLDNQLRLRDLEYLKEEEGKIFRDSDPDKCIDQRYRKRILQTQIMMNIIDPQTPNDVKFDIFKRINQGGRPLNSQEIRNCMSSVDTRELIGRLSKSKAFLDATCSSVGVVRMQDQELVLRFLAFRLSQLGTIVEYSGSMDRFLDQAIGALNNAPREIVQRVESEFLRAMRNAAHLFGQFAFRKCLPSDLLPGVRRRLINNALFTTCATVLASYDEHQVSSLPVGQFAVELADKLQSDPVLLDCVTSGTNDRRRLAYTFSAIQNLCDEHLL
nr:DUF262 domain-containing protein [Pseudomonas sp. UBA6718]